MKPEDRARRDDLASDLDGWSRSDGAFLLRIIDEQAAEIARLEYYCFTCGGELPIHKPGCLRISTLETQLAEERAKREAAEKSRDDWRNQWAGLLMHEDAAKRLSEANKTRADRAERELAEERAKRDLAYDTATLHMRHSRQMFVSANSWRERAEKAEARIIAVEAELRDAQRNEVHLETCLQSAEARVAELQALVDAATEASEFWRRMWNRAMCGCFAADCRKHGAYASEDVDRSRDLAAKEKEPK